LVKAFGGFMVLVIASTSASAQLSPGELHRAHASLEGLGSCTACHAIGSGAFDQQCLACHTVLAARIEAGAGLHAKPGYRRCQDCHVDHQGRDFEMIFWGEAGKEGFDHELTGFPLDGAHAERGCRACHAAEHIAEPEVLTAAGKDLGRTYLGLRGACVSCHADAHGDGLSDDCAACHQTDAWSPAPGFDHGETAFPLVGKHADAACTACHAPHEDEAMRIFEVAGFASCVGCHEDVHVGQLGSDCGTCHVEEQWQPAPRFDHGLADFALTGRHSKVACEACHPREGELVRYVPIRSDRCVDCHEDYHEGRLGEGCESCHQTTAWSRVETRDFDHEATRYPLAGRHTEVRCEACHTTSRGTRGFPFGSCDDCHLDVHVGQLTATADATCADCHTVLGFLPADFPIGRHEESGFPLRGRHEAVPCFLCHVETEIGGQKTNRYRFDEPGCVDCHEDAHQGKATRAVASYRTGDDPCTVCHLETSWGDSVFDHAQTRVRLDGAHEGLSCRACHGEGENLAFSDLSGDCASCHEDVHRGQFAVEGSTDCARCHVTRDWRPDRFDHGSDSRFDLRGAHRDTPCESCHPRVGNTVHFKPIETRCEACHDRGPE